MLFCLLYNCYILLSDVLPHDVYYEKETDGWDNSERDEKRKSLFEIIFLYENKLKINIIQMIYIHIFFV